jgi:hypothetical protein
MVAPTKMKRRFTNQGVEVVGNQLQPGFESSGGSSHSQIMRQCNYIFFLRLYFIDMYKCNFVMWGFGICMNMTVLHAKSVNSFGLESVCGVDKDMKECHTARIVSLTWYIFMIYPSLAKQAHAMHFL